MKQPSSTKFPKRVKTYKPHELPKMAMVGMGLKSLLPSNKSSIHVTIHTRGPGRPCPSMGLQACAQESCQSDGDDNQITECHLVIIMPFWFFLFYNKRRMRIFKFYISLKPFKNVDHPLADFLFKLERFAANGYDIELQSSFLDTDACFEEVKRICRLKPGERTG